ncbi:MAG: hypothetical protein EZS28_012407 [Streblomastix strix]|uniref:SHSP domain-containing protein n=1 Tax=Streblomastix strix TaxID=222440 RepID=A0A5J4WBX2_9EUKA|nr:MAG: hypothetical protein EZS28_012407 [Streblomastix strix]
MSNADEGSISQFKTKKKKRISITGFESFCQSDNKKALIGASIMLFACADGYSFPTQYENEFVVHAELPEILKDKVKVDYDRVCNILSLKYCTIKEHHEVSKEGASFKSDISEHRFGQLRCEFNLPDEYNDQISEITASSTN